MRICHTARRALSYEIRMITSPRCTSSRTQLLPVRPRPNRHSRESGNPWHRALRSSKRKRPTGFRIIHSRAWRRPKSLGVYGVALRTAEQPLFDRFRLPHTSQIHARSVTPALFVGATPLSGAARARFPSPLRRPPRSLRGTPRSALSFLAWAHLKAVEPTRAGASPAQLGVKTFR